MPLACIDLDNTLLDRASGFRRWAEGFVATHGITDDDAIAFLVAADGDGHVPKEEFFRRVKLRFDLDEPVEQLIDAFHEPYLAGLELHAGAADGLRRLRGAGWKLAITTNGPGRQLDKTEKLGLDDLVDVVVASALVGVRKPDPRIFEIAAEGAGTTLDGAWVVGDTPTHDIAGAVRAELDSIWISRGREWTEPGFEPTVVVDSFAKAVEVLLRA